MNDFKKEKIVNLFYITEDEFLNFQKYLFNKGFVWCDGTNNYLELSYLRNDPQTKYFWYTTPGEKYIIFVYSNFFFIRLNKKDNSLFTQTIKLIKHFKESLGINNIPDFKTMQRREKLNKIK